MKIKGAYDCAYCHGDIDEACTDCDPECNCLELHNHQIGECELDCQFCEEEQRRIASQAASSLGKLSARSRFKGMTEKEKSEKMKELSEKRWKKTD